MTEPVNKQTLFSFFQRIVLLFCHIYDMVHVTSDNFSVKTAAGSRFQRKNPPKQHYMLPAQHFCNAEEARAVNPCDSECFFLAIWNKTWCYNCRVHSKYTQNLKVKLCWGRAAMPNCVQRYPWLGAPLGIAGQRCA